MLATTAAAVTGILTTGFVLTFTLNLVLNGVMSQLWSIFNTLQIIMALPMLSVMLPANVIAVNKIVYGVINFQMVDKQTLSETFLEPMFG